MGFDTNSGFGIDMVTVALFGMIEIFCIITNIKCFRSSINRCEPVLIIVFLTIHLSLIMVITMLFLGYVSGSEKALLVLNFIAILAKDCFVFTLAWRILTVVQMLDEDNKLPGIMIKVIWGLMSLHTICLAVISFFVCDLKTALSACNSQVIYQDSTIVIIGIIYGYACFNSIWILKSSNEKNESGYIKWLIITMLYMIIGMAIRIISNIGEIFEVQNKLNNISRIYLRIYMAIMYNTTIMIPCLFMCICLYKMAFESNEETGNNDSKYTDSAERFD